MRPTIHLSKTGTTVDLQAQVPAEFGQWREVKDLTPLLPDPSLQAKLDSLYTQILARTYRHADGRTVMLSIAYGSDQSSEATAVHRPEFCYAAQGFAVADAGTARLFIRDAGKPLLTQRLLARQGTRIEPITYWVTLDEQAVLPGLDRKLTQMRYGLRGLIPDGMLVRVSNLESGRETSGFEAQASFLHDLSLAIDPSIRDRYFGAP